MRHHKEVWKQKFNLIFISLRLSEMQGKIKCKNAFQNFILTYFGHFWSENSVSETSQKNRWFIFDIHGILIMWEGTKKILEQIKHVRLQWTSAT